MDHNVTDKLPKVAIGRFELAAARMADAWVRTGRITVGRDDLRAAREFFERAGWIVREVPGGRVQLTRPRGRKVHEFSREGLVLDALRRLAGRKVPRGR
jgi:hypothetical protein